MNMIYDAASWHYDGEFPESSPDEYGATHIALIMKWCFIKGWAGELHHDDNETKQELNKVISGEMQATEYFLDRCDGKLTDEDFNDEGNSFLQYYYEDKDLYTTDYVTNFSEHMYVLGEEEHDFDKFSSMVEKRYKKYLKRHNPWWQFW